MHIVFKFMYQKNFLELAEKHMKHVISVGLGCRIKVNSPLVGPAPAGGIPSVGVFLREQLL